MPITHMISEKYDMVDGKYTKIAEAYPETFAHGCVLKTGTRSVRIMSDVWGTERYAIYWDATQQKPVDVWLDTCDYGWMYNEKVHAEVDATPEVKAAYRQYLIDIKLKYLIGDAEIEAKQFAKGCTASVTRGKTAKGTVGKVVVIMKARYGMGYHSSIEDKLGIATSDITYKKALANGKVVDAHKDIVWVWARNCVRVDIASIDLEGLQKHSEALIDATLAA